MSQDPIKISICITQYNENVNPLLSALCEEIDTYRLPISIYIRDDNSNHNHPIKVDKSYIIIRKNRENLGRSRNRNAMVSDAEGIFLLFLDGDVMPFRKDFLRKYLNYSRNSNGIVCSGGILYPSLKPPSEKLLHYRYGKCRESRVTISVHLKTSNLLIRKNMIAETPFDESLNGYGHEDSLLSYMLRKQGINIDNIKNPIVHKGLMTNHEFLIKQEAAINSLIQLHRKGYKDVTSLQSVYLRIKDSFFLNFLSRPALIKSLKWLLLKIPQLNLKVLDLYKLLLYNSLLSEEGKV